MTAPSLDAVRERFPDAVEARDEVTVVVHRDELPDRLRELKRDQAFSFDFLSDLTASDWPDREPRFWLAYHLLSIEHTHRVRVKTGLPPDPDPPHVASVVGAYPTADWLEREVWDMFGVRFEGHPDLRRLLLYEEFVGHPLRKDYPINRRQPLIGPKV